MTQFTPARLVGSFAIALFLLQTGAAFALPAPAIARAIQSNQQAQAPDSIEGIWVGSLTAGAVSLRTVIRISKGADGALIGMMDSPDQGAMGMALSNVTFKDGKLNFL